jgi:integrase
MSATINGPGAALTAPGLAQEVLAPMPEQRRPRRARGTGSIIRRRQSSGAVVLWGKFSVHGERRWVRLGVERQPGSKLGLTRPQAEGQLRREFEKASLEQPRYERLEIREVGERYIDRLEGLGRKRTTIADYRSTLRVHLVPFFGGRSLEQVDVQLVEAFITAKQREGKAPKSISNYLGLLYSIFEYAVKRGLARSNPVAAADKPRVEARDTDIHYIEIDELEELIAAVPEDALGGVERVLYRTAAMTGLRRGELLALRWRDVDWSAGVVRVRRSYTRGEFGTPKSRRSSRAVPLPDLLAVELECHFQHSLFCDDDDLVFAHPQRGTVLDPSRLRKRFKSAARRANLRDVRFHDLRHTFGTRMAAAGAPLRAIQEWMGHSDHRTTLIYADYAPDPSQGALWAARAFAPNSIGSPPSGNAGRDVLAPLHRATVAPSRSGP